MSANLLLADALGLFLVAAGLILAFRQNLVRGWVDARRRKRGKAQLGQRPREQDPLDYAMTIAGTMVMAFGIMLFGFATAYSLG